MIWDFRFQTVGDNQAFILMGFMGVTGILSMLISNTATTAMMLPIVKAVSDSLGQVHMIHLFIQHNSGHIENTSIEK